MHWIWCQSNSHGYACWLHECIKLLIIDKIFYILKENKNMLWHLNHPSNKCWCADCINSRDY
jgi:hypothetical protein